MNEEHTWSQYNYTVYPDHQKGSVQRRYCLVSGCEATIDSINLVSDNFDDKERFDAFAESKENPTTSAQSIEEEAGDLRN